MSGYNALRIFLIELYLMGVEQGLDLSECGVRGRFAIDAPVTGTPTSVRVKYDETVGKLGRAVLVTVRKSPTEHATR